MAKDGWDSFGVRRGIDSGAQIRRGSAIRGGSTVGRSSAAMEATASLVLCREDGFDTAFIGTR